MTINLTNFIWLIGGSIMSEPMSQEIKRRGYNLLLTDGNSNCHCRQYADDFKPISVYDDFNNMALARLCREKPKAVLCIGCDAGPTQSILADYFDLPGVKYHTAVRVKDKFEMRKATNFEHPWWSWSDPVTKNLYYFPCLIKSYSQSGSKGLKFIRGKSELPDFLNDDQFIEEYCEGQDLFPEIEQFDTSEIALDCLVQNGKVIHLNGALRLFWRDLIGIEAGHINPFIPDRKVMSLVRKAAKRLDVDQGIFKVDLKYTKKYGWIILECATRPSGGFDHFCTSPRATGKDVTGIILDTALGLPLDKSKLKVKTPNQYVCAYAPRFRPGLINGWMNTAQFKPEVFFRLTMNEIRELDCNQNRPLFVMMKGGSELEAVENAVKMSKSIWPVYA